MKLAWVYIVVFIFLMEEAFSDEEKHPGEHNAEVYIVAVGAKPSRRYADDARYDSPIMLLPESGTVPPARLFYKTTSIEGEAQWEVLNIPFNSAPLVKTLPAGKSLRLYQKLSGEYEFYMTLPKQSEGKQSLLVLTPSKKGKGLSSENKPWDESPEIHQLNFDRFDQSDDGVFLKNISSVIVETVIGDQAFKMKPGDFSHQFYKSKSNFISLSASYLETRSKQLICKTTISVYQQERQLLLVYYDANTETNAGKKVGIHRLLIPKYRRSGLAPSE